VFNRVFRLVIQIQSVILVFSTPIAPLTFSLVHLPPPLPKERERGRLFSQHSVKVKVQYVQTVWAGRGWGCWVVLETIFCRSSTLCFLTSFRTYKIDLPSPNKKPRKGGGLRQMNTCRKVPLLFKKRKYQINILVQGQMYIIVDVKFSWTCLLVKSGARK
jgi:hypothetical protein